jgi:hypothetical protein
VRAPGGTLSSGRERWDGGTWGKRIAENAGFGLRADGRGTGFTTSIHTPLGEEANMETKVKIEVKKVEKILATATAIEY